MAEEQSALSFSGGKDSILALDRLTRTGKHINYLVTMYDAVTERVRFHGVPITHIQAQADALGIPLLRYPTTPENFETVFLQSLQNLRQLNVTEIAFGNIHLADVRAWYEERTTGAGLTHLEPLWDEDPAKLVRECIARGYLATLTCIEVARAKAEWLGATLTEQLVDEFEQGGIDPCGERGEYHTFVSAGPLFAHPLPTRLGSKKTMAGFQLVDILL
ncbi:MAG TPA: diphthine--ammonia ligase [Ktedonobacteraceae bacterium]|nr:diphthine--ammonia ligase [Ktedonobacteraceae bacterium]